MNSAYLLALPLMAFTIFVGCQKPTKIFYLGFFIYWVVLLVAKFLTPFSAIMLLVSLALIYYYKYKGKFGQVALCLSVLLMLLVGLKLLPGLDKIILMGPTQLSKASLAWTWEISFYKGVLGVGLAAILFSQKTLTAKLFVFPSALSAAVVLLAYWSGYGVDAKFYPFTIPFLVSNLLFTVVAEETFFRLCIQQPLAKKIGPTYALAVVTLLFGLAHFGGGIHYMLLSTVAGFAYALVFYRYHNVVLSCYCHWLVNILHFLLLTYPR